MNHQSGSSGWLCVWALVLMSGAHGGGCTWSTLSFMYLAKRVMNNEAGTSCGVGKVGCVFLFDVSVCYSFGVL